MKLHTALLALTCGALLCACDQPLEERGCHDEGVQTLVKKLVVIHLNDAMATKSSSQRLMDALMKERNRQSGLDTTFNTLKSGYTKVERVSLSEIAELKNPKTAADGASPGSPASSGPAIGTDLARPGEGSASAPAANHYLYMCSAKVSAPLPPAAAQRVAQRLPELIDLPSQSVSLRIFYTTESNAHKQLEVGMAFENQLMLRMLDLLLGDTLAPAPSGASSAPE